MIKKMLFRELKSSPTFFMIFILNLSIGLMGISTIEVFKSSFNDALSSKSKELLGSDISISSRIKISDEKLELTKSALDYDKFAQNSSLFTMVFSGEKSRLVNIRAFDTGYPFYGELKSLEGKNFSEITDVEVVLFPDIAKQLELKIGDTLRLGEADFKVAGIVDDEASTGLSFAQIAPRLFIKKNALERTQLIKPGSTVSRSVHFMLTNDLDKDSLEVKRKELEESIADSAIRVNTPSTKSVQVGRAMNYLSDFLGLVSLCGLLLAGLGLIYLFRSFLLKRQRDIGILNFIGIKKKDIFKIYSLKLLFLGVVGSIIGVGLGVLFTPLIDGFIESALGVNIALSFNFQSIVISLIVGIISTIVLAPALILPYLRVDSKALFSHESAASSKFADYLLYLPVFIFYWLVAIYLSKSLIVGSIFIGAIIAIILIFFPLGNFTLKRLALVKFKGSFPTRLAIKYVTRHRVSTLFIFFCLIISTTLMTLIPSIKTVLQGELSMPTDKAPVFFLFDIQDEQSEELKSFIKEEKLELLNMSPMVKGRLLKINGEKFNASKLKGVTREEERGRRTRNRTVNLSYRGYLTDSEEMTKGTFPKAFDFEKDEYAEVSLEERYASRLGVNIGDMLEFDVLGMPVISKVVSFRKIRWTSFSPNFFISFGEGVLEEAPKTYVASISNPNGLDTDKVQTSFAKTFTNISLVDVGKAIEKVSTIISSITSILFIMTALVFLVGIMVIYSLVSHQLITRKRDIFLLNIIGVTKDVIHKSIVKEMKYISGASVIIGLFLGQVVTVVVANFMFNTNSSFNIFETGGYALAIFVISVLISYISLKFSGARRK